VHINFCANSHDHIQTTDLRPDTAHAFNIDRTLRTPVRVVRQAASTLRTGIPTADFSGNPVFRAVGTVRNYPIYRFACSREIILP